VGSATRVLVVEDDPVDVLAVERILLCDQDESRFEVRHAATLAEGFDELGRQPVDVLLLDLSLPDSDGVDTVARVRKQAPHVPLVVFTGSDAPKLAATTLEAGADGHLSKDALGQLDLRRSLWRAIGKRGAIRRGAAVAEPARRKHADEQRTPHAESVELTAFVRRVEPLLRTVIPDHVTLRLCLSEELPPTTAEVKRLFGALLELIGNAVGAIGKSEGTVEVRTGAGRVEAAECAQLLGSRRLAPGPQLWLEVCDTGRGFDAATLLHENGSEPDGEMPGGDYGDSHLEEMLREGEASLLVDGRPGVGAAFRILLPIRAS
ncbi:MAG: response regulator, partial [Myxococcota bacterium]